MKRITASDTVVNKRSSDAVRWEREQTLDSYKKQTKTVVCTFYRGESITQGQHRNLTSQYVTCRQPIAIFLIRNRRFASSVSFCHGAAKRQQKNFLRGSQRRWRIGIKRTQPQETQASRLQAQEEASWSRGFRRSAYRASGKRRSLQRIRAGR